MSTEAGVDVCICSCQEQTKWYNSLKIILSGCLWEVEHRTGFWIGKIYYIVCPFFSNWIGFLELCTQITWATLGAQQ